MHVYRADEPDATRLCGSSATKVFRRRSSALVRRRSMSSCGRRAPTSLTLPNRPVAQCDACQIWTSWPPRKPDTDNDNGETLRPRPFARRGGGRRSGRWCLVRLGRRRWRDRCGPGIRCSRRGRWPPCRVGQDRRAATIAEHDATLEGYAHESLRRRWSRQRLGRAATVGCRPAGQIDIGGGDVGTREGCPIRVRRLAVRESELQSRCTG